LKKITFLINSLAGGGAEGVCVNIANALAENGWKVDLVILHLNDSTYHGLISNKVNFISLGVNHARYAGIPLLKYIYNEKPEVILVFNYELAVLLVILRGIFRFNTKIIARNINTLSQKRKQISSFWRKYLVAPLIDVFYCKVDHVINQCDAMQSDLLSFYPNLNGRSSVIYNPIAKYIEEYFQNNESTKMIKQNYLLCVGRLEKQKAFYFAIQAFSNIAKEFPDLRLKIVGRGSLEQNLKEFALDLGVGSRVDFEGYQSDMIPFFLNAKVTVLTSLFEGFPNVLVESIALGTPVVAFNCPSGPGEIIIDGVNGFLVPYLQEEFLVESLRLAMLKRWNVNEIIKTSERYDLSIILGEYEKVLV